VSLSTKELVRSIIFLQKSCMRSTPSLACFFVDTKTIAKKNPAKKRVGLKQVSIRSHENGMTTTIQ